MFEEVCIDVVGLDGLLLKDGRHPAAPHCGASQRSITLAAIERCQVVWLRLPHVSAACSLPGQLRALSLT